MFFKCSEKMVFPKKLYWNMIFLISWEKMAFIFPVNGIFFTDGKWKMIFLKKYMEIWCFLYIGKGGISFSYKYEITLLSNYTFLKYNLQDYISGITEKDEIHPRKDDIGILDWYSTKSSNDSMYFYGDLFKCFHILLSNEKNPRKLNL